MSLQPLMWQLGRHQSSPSSLSSSSSCSRVSSPSTRWCEQYSHCVPSKSFHSGHLQSRESPDQTSQPEQGPGTARWGPEQPAAKAVKLASSSGSRMLEKLRAPQDAQQSLRLQLRHPTPLSSQIHDHAAGSLASMLVQSGINPA
jgi:hypothetical protein